MKHFLTLFDEAIKKYWDMPALTNYDENSLTYARLASEIKKYHILFKRCGVKKGDKIALCTKNSVEWCVVYFATITYDAVTVPLLPDFLPKNIAELTCFSDSTLLFVDEGIFSGLNSDNILDIFKQQPNFLGVMGVKGDKPFLVCDNNLLSYIDGWGKEFDASYSTGVKKGDVNFSKTDMEALTVISFTSGTSSLPKGVMLPARSLSFNVNKATELIPAVRPGYRVLTILPLAHMFAQTFDFLFPIVNGCHITILNRKPTPVRLMEALANVKPFMFLLVPMIIEKIFRAKVFPLLKKPAVRILMAIPGVDKLILGVIRRKLLKTFGGELHQSLMISGAPLNKEVEKLMVKMRFPYTVGYGMTECGPAISYQDWRKLVPYSGAKVVYPTQCRIISPDEKNIPGEIQVKGDLLMLGYYKNPEATKDVFTDDGWLRTGDMGTLDENMNIFIRGRCKNMILTGTGQNIYPEEIEDKLNNLPLVSESIIVERSGLLFALIVPNLELIEKAKIDIAEVEKTMVDNLKVLNVDLPSYSKIVRYELMDEPFEKTPKQSIKRFKYS